MRNRSGILLDRTHRLGAVLLQRLLTLSDGGGGGGDLQAPTPIALSYEVEGPPTPNALYYQVESAPTVLGLTFNP